MNRRKNVHSLLPTEPAEIAEAQDLWWRVARVYRPTENDWQAMRRLKELFGVHFPGDWPYLQRLIEKLLETKVSGAVQTSCLNGS